MRTWIWFALGAMLLAMGTVYLGCGSDDSDDNGVTDPVLKDRYIIEAFFESVLVSGGTFSAYVGRIEADDPSAKECVVTVNGTSIPLVTLVSTDDDAVFTKINFGYEAGNSYTVQAALNGRTATCSFTAPVVVYPVIDTPAADSGFQPGDPIEVTWHYDGDTPTTNVYLEAWGEGDDPLYAGEFSGTTTSHTISGSVTDDWEGEGDVLITVDLGEMAWPFTGDLPATGSVVATVLPGDACIVIEGQHNPQWTLSVIVDASELPADGESELLVIAEIMDEFSIPCPNGTEVVFSLSPASAGTISPVTAYTTGGSATTTFTAGTTAGPVTITAQALGLSDSGGLDLTEVVTYEITVGTGANPAISWTPTDSMFGLLMRQTGGVGTLRWSILATGLSGFGSPVTYGTPPPGTQQLYPLLGAAPQALQTGSTYQIGLVTAEGDTLYREFTH